MSKVNNRSKELDQWYTKQEVAEMCVDIMIDSGYLKEFDSVIEPSAGEGVFIDVLKKKLDKYSTVTAFDLDPKRDDIVKDNWFNYKGSETGSIVIGNPPYGKKGKLAVSFINHALKYHETVGFIVPKVLSTSYTAQKHIDIRASLVLEVELPDKSFIFNEKEASVPSVFQIWKKVDTNIRLSVPQTEHKDLSMRIYNKTDGSKRFLKSSWDIAVRRNSKKGEFILKGEEATEDCHWILIKGNVDILKKIDWSKLNDNKMTAGMGKADVVKAYMEAINEH